MTDLNLKRAKAHTIYRVDGKRVPGVTTVLGVLAKPALIHWAWDLGTKGLDYRAVRDGSADVGTLAHGLIADELRGTLDTPLDTFTDEQKAFAGHCIRSWIAWKADHNLKPELIETPLVSAKYGYGGTIDIYGKLGRSKELIDLKTGNAIYPEMLAQLAAYRQLLIEHGYTVKKARILRIGRNPSEGWEERTVDDLGPYWDLFSGALAVYKAQQTIRGAE